MKHTGLVGLALMMGVLGAECALAALKPGAGPVPFWIGLQNNQQLDQQVATLLADHAAIVLIRTADSEKDNGKLRAKVNLLKKMMPTTPILGYGWSSRNVGKKGSAGLTDWLDTQPELQITGANGRKLARFGDVTKPDYQSRTAANIAASVERGGFDGIGLDLSIRTPKYKPLKLATICAKDEQFCARYAQGMDATFKAIRAALGDHAFVYNGLWNLGPGSVADQQKLLEYADAAIVEFFGSTPKKSQNNFTHDILPFVQAMRQIPASKKMFVYGRGSLRYTSYAEDYATQRYLYSAFLLGAGTNAWFKYHSTFQADVPSGRTGGLSVFSDWFNNLGNASGPFVVKDGLYSRLFANGLVIVAPDDGSGGTYNVPHPMFSLEGNKVSGRVALKPGQGILLLDKAPAKAGGSNLLDLKLLADWPRATLVKNGSSESLSLAGDAAVGSHDMLLDAVRSLAPSNNLKMTLQANDQSAGMSIVAEVDDPSNRTEFAILDIGAPNAAAGGRSVRQMTFGGSSTQRAGFPVIKGPALTPGSSQTLDLDGHALFAGSKLVFRRWDYVRFNGAMKIQAIKLDH